MPKRRLISFDWAMKRVLRSKANFDILEGFLSELLRDDIRILEVLESESNKDRDQSKLVRLDLKVRNAKNEIVIIEVQYEQEWDYLQRIMYGASRTLIEHLDKGEPYSNLVKVISVNILYFDLGQGEDYVYHGTTRFLGMHRGDELQLTSRQQDLFMKSDVPSLYPEYYLLKINQFNDIAKDPLDEWIYFLKNQEIKAEFQARGLKRAKEELDILQLPEAERAAYERYEDDLHYQASMVLSSYGTGKMDGRKEGLIEGREEGRKEGLIEGREDGMKAARISIARNLLNILDLETISEKTGLRIEELKKLKDHD